MTGVGHQSTFVHEAGELLAQIEDAALALESAPDDREHVNLLFRAFHTLKGSAGMVGFDAITAFTHHVETALDHVRDGRVAVTPELIGALLASKDHVQALLAAACAGEQADTAPGDVLIAQLQKLASIGTPQKQGSDTGAPRVRSTYHVRFRLRHTADDPPLSEESFLSELAAHGCYNAAQCAEADAQFGPTWDGVLTTTSEIETVRDVFLFAPNGSEIVIERGLCEFVTEPPAPLTQVNEAPKTSIARPNEAGGTRGVSRADMVKVPSERLDQLVKLVGELVITQSRLKQAHTLGSLTDLAGPVEAMERLISELRDSVFGVRMMPIGPTFARFKRLARDLSAQLGKEIELVTEGDETELDKTVLDQLGDPLVHLIRNSMDHGIELPSEREAAGKPRKGRIVLSAVHDGGHVVLTIRDDGRGLDRAAIRAKAEQKGLVAPGEHLSEQDVLELIMRPGFSTAQAVTQLSGRGVGMDVVKKIIETLRGSISIASTRGEGTTVRLSLPLTLAIIDGLLVQVQGDSFVVPMAAVMENVELSRTERTAYEGRTAIAVRGELVPYVGLRELFGDGEDGPALEKVVIVSVDGVRIGLVVDGVLGMHQTVIQPLGPFFRSVELFSGSTILGDGRVALIVDLAGVVRRAERNTARSRECGAGLAIGSA